MPKILGPCLELLWCQANCLSKADEGISEAMRVEVGQPRVGKRLMEDFTNGSGRAPVLPFEPLGRKLVGFVQDYIRSRKEGIVMTPEFLLPQIPHPVDHNLVNFVSDREKIRDERLAELGMDLPCILKDASHDHIHMLQFH